MSCLLVSPPLGIKFDLLCHLTNYYIARSFQKNWTRGFLIHLPVPRPSRDDLKLAAGDHYLHWKLSPFGEPLATILFTLLPAFDFNIKTFVKPSSQYDGPAIFVIGQVLPDYISHIAADALQAVGERHHIDPTPFITLLDNFCQDFYRPHTPTLKPHLTLTIPLGCNQ